MARQRHAVVTGGGSGIGAAIAAALDNVGCSVTIMGRSRPRLDAALRTMPRARSVACDVTDAASVEGAFNEATAMSGPVAILINNAGLVRTAPFGKQTDADWEGMWRTNVMGSVYATRMVLTTMRGLPSGRIINIASTASLKGYAYASAYSASKHALLGLTRSLALELAETSITVNAICPGYTDTDIISDAVANIVKKTGRSEEAARDSLIQVNPQRRLIDPREVAAAVCWLISEEAQSVTGQSIAIAGGEIM